MTNNKGKLKAVILVGGLGTRLRPLTDNLPKPVVPVLNRPAMEHTFAYLKQYGINDIVLAMNYLPDAIKGYFGDGSRCGVQLSYCLESEPMGTAGAVKNAASHLDDTFFVMNGDIFSDLNLAEMLASHRRNGAKATISLTWVNDPSAFGVVETDGNNRVKRFIEKPPPAEATTHWINAGTYILEPEVLGYIPANVHYMFERGLFPGLLEANEPVYGYPYRGFWLDMGTPGKYFSLNMDFLTGKVKTPLLKEIASGERTKYYGIDTAGHNPDGVLPPVLIGDGSTIGGDVRLNGPVIIGRDCRLGDKTVVENAIIWDNVNIGENALLKNCIISNGAVISARQEVIDCIFTPTRTVHGYV